MALLFYDGFDSSINTFIGARWSFVSSCNIVTGRTGSGNALRTAGSPAGYAYRNLGANFSTLYAGFAYTPLTATASPGHIIAGFMDTAAYQIYIVFSNLGTVNVYRQGTLLATGTTTWTASTWKYVEIKVVFATGTGGSVVVRLDGVTEHNLTGINTAPTGNAYANQFRIGPDTSHSTSGAFLATSYDDVYVLDDSGAQCNTFLGDIKCECLFPNGNGNHSQFTNQLGNSTNNYLYVDEASGTYPNSDTDYNQDTVNGNRNSYTLSNLSVATPGTIYAVQAMAFARKIDAGSKQVANFLRTNSTNFDATPVSLSDSYAYYSSIYELNPDGSVAWDVTTINALEAGVKVAS